MKEKLKQLRLLLILKGVVLSPPITINKGTELTLLKDPTYAGYTFKGWYDTNETPIHNNALLEEDITLYAKWEKIAETKQEPKKEEKISLIIKQYIA